jgi:DsbC/DsbD-like thiol-disulfide interchange protein
LRFGTQEATDNLNKEVQMTGQRVAAGMLLVLMFVVAADPLRWPAAQAGLKKADAVVKVSAKADPDKPGADGQQVVTVSFEIDKGWHIYANPVGDKDYESAATVVEVRAKNPPVVKVEYPTGVKDKTEGNHYVYEDKVAIKATVRRTGDDTGPLEVSATFQACNDKEKACLRRATVKLTVP